MAATSVRKIELWPLNEASRKKIVDKISSNLASMSFFEEQGLQVDDSVAAIFAVTIESEAFNATETKVREESLTGTKAVMFYARTASQKMVEALKSKELRATAVKVEGPSVEGESFDISGGKREFVTKEVAEKLLEPLLTTQNKFQKVRLSGKSFGLDAVDAVAQALENHAESLTEADLSDIIAGRPEEEALSVLVRISQSLTRCRLTSLNLSDNAFGEKGVRACGEGLKAQSSLKKLFFCNNGISKEAAAAIAELVPCPENLTTLHFFNNMTGDEGAKTLAGVIASASSLQDLRFSSTRVGTEGALALADAIKQGTSLVRVDMRDNMFGEEGGVALAQALSQHPGLLEVCLADTGLGDNGCAIVASTLSSSAVGEGSTGLIHLNLGGNELSPAGATQLAASLEKLPALKSLVLCDNELGDKGAVIIANTVAKHSRSLEELDLSTNEIGRVGAVAAARAVAGLEGFKLLNVNGNAISEMGIEAIKEVLAAGKGGVGVLGPLDENDEEGEEEEEEEREGEDDKELDERLGGLAV